jgi:hypothetical protein
MTIMETSSSGPRSRESEGTVTRYGDVTLLVGPGDEQVVARLLAAGRAANAHTGDLPDQGLSQTVAHLLATSEHVPAVCAIHEMSDGVAALVHGDARVRIQTERATLELSSAGAVTVDGFIAGKATSVRAELGPAGEASPSVTNASAADTEASRPVGEASDSAVQASDPPPETSDTADEPSGSPTDTGDPTDEASAPMTGRSDPTDEASASTAATSDPVPEVIHLPTCPLAHQHDPQPSADEPRPSRPEPDAAEPPAAKDADPPVASAEPPSGPAVTSVELELEVSPPLVPAESPASEPLTVTAVATSTGSDGVSHAVTATITGVRCRKGHFNDPELAYCGICGIGLTQAGRVFALDERPVLGVLLLDDGRLLPLDRDYVLGSAPDLAEDVQRGEATAVWLQDDLVSDLHARVSLRGWEVNVSDIGSTHGTYVREPEGGDWQPLSSGSHRTLRPGGLIAIGARQLRFDTYRN